MCALHTGGTLSNVLTEMKYLQDSTLWVLNLHIYTVFSTFHLDVKSLDGSMPLLWHLKVHMAVEVKYCTLKVLNFGLTQDFNNTS